VRRAGDAPPELEDHPRVDLDGHDGLGALEQAQRQVPGAGPDLEDDVGGLDARFLDDGVDDRGVLEDVLPSGLEELDAWWCLEFCRSWREKRKERLAPEVVEREREREKRAAVERKDAKCVSHRRKAQAFKAFLFTFSIFEAIFHAII
jgi:hypothetical protein